MSTQAICSAVCMDSTKTGWSKMSRMSLVVWEPPPTVGLGESQKIPPVTASLASLVLLRLGIVETVFLLHR